jgi:CheY-like chemotaxis protein
VSGASILIVEDESIVAADLEQQLRQDGYRVLGIAGSGQEAVRLAADLLPDIVLMDVRLHGGMDGVEAAQQIQRTTGTPIVYLTAYPGVFIQDPSRMQYPNLCLMKPFVASELRTVIDAALDARGTHPRPS